MENDEHNFQNGALLDVRPQEEKDKDYRFEELVSAPAAVEWIEKKMADLRKFPIFHQNGSGSCVAQTMRKILGVLYWLKYGKFVDFSATHIYQRRSNKPSGGMWGVEAFNIARKGVTLEEFAESDHMTDAEMDGMKIVELWVKIGEAFKLTNFVVLPSKDFDVAASTIQKTGKAIMMWFHFLYSEWTECPTIKDPNLPESGANVLRHSVSGTDVTLIGQSNLPSHRNAWGKQAIFMEDSWGSATAIDGRRFITREFYEKRNFFTAYPISFVYDDQTQPEPQPNPQPNPSKPKHTFVLDLEKGQRGEDIVALQNVLKYEGCFPKNIDSTGYYWSVTSDAVYKFQMKHKVADAAELDALKGNRVGAKTRAKLNELYSK